MQNNEICLEESETVTVLSFESTKFMKQFWREWNFETALLLIFVNATECNNAKRRQFNNKQKEKLLSVIFPLLLPLHTDQI